MAKQVKCWGEIFPSINAVTRDSRCKMTRSGLQSRLKLGMPLEEAASLFFKRSFKCWGTLFPSIRAIAKDPRCVVTHDGLRLRLKAGMDLETAATRRNGKDFSHETKTTKFCRYCNKLKTLQEFHKSPTQRKGVMSLCKTCNAKSHKEWVMKQYKDFSLEKFNMLVKKQKSRCACCKQKTKLVVDHCHKSEKVRALLCSACNTSLGLLQESPKRCDQLKAYIKKHST